jgi:polyhydroxybutyrate depolymerase
VKSLRYVGYCLLALAATNCGDAGGGTSKCEGSACADDAPDADDDDSQADDDGDDDGSPAPEPDEDDDVVDAGAGAKPADAAVSANDARAREDSGSTTQRDAAAPPTATADASMPAPPVMMGGPARKSAGCGNMSPPEAGTKMIDVDGTAREYIVALPQSYDASKPYRLVFAWHGLGGTAASIARSWYGLSRRAENSTIFVAGQGLATSGNGGAGWPNTGGRDVAFVQKLYELLRTNYCVDETRVFSTGMSYGGIMSNTLGCSMGDVFRAIAPMAGSGPLSFRGGACKGQPAVWLTHGNTDTVVSFASGQASRDHWVKSNHCDMQTMPTAPAGCLAYQGCDEGRPVHWCEFAGGHTVPPFASEAIWNFFAQF